MSFNTRLLTEDQVNTKRPFWVNSTTRDAQTVAKAILAKHLSTSSWYFLGEHNDGLWLAFLEEGDREIFAAIYEKHVWPSEQFLPL